MIPGTSACPVLVLGMGNILLEDEGLGIRALEVLQREYEFPSGVELLDGGTTGMGLLDEIGGRQHVLVLDAVQTGDPPGTLVVMLPRRLQTLRTADRVVLLNGPRLVGEGKHAQLLADSDLYRHLNYLLFNPYRHQRADV